LSPSHGAPVPSPFAANPTLYNWPHKHTKFILYKSHLSINQINFNFLLSHVITNIIIIKNLHDY